MKFFTVKGYEEVSSLEDIAMMVKESTRELQKGDNIIIEADNHISLLKYEGAELGSFDPLRVRMSRDTILYRNLNNLMQSEDESYTHEEPSKRITAKARADILGTHKIDFAFDEEFREYFPSTDYHTDLYLMLAKIFGDGRVKENYDTVNIITGEEFVKEKLQKITRPGYYEKNIVPFLENRPTDLDLPGKKSLGYKIGEGLLDIIEGNTDKRKPFYSYFNAEVAHKWIANATKELEHGDFVYIGSKEEVYLLRISKDNNSPTNFSYMPGAKPAFWFSNVCLGLTDSPGIKKSLLECAKVYENTKDGRGNIAGFDGKPFIFSAMGREENLNNRAFYGEPEIITGDLSEALEHFKTTDFFEFEDIVRYYGEKSKNPGRDAEYKDTSHIEPCLY